MYGNKTNEYFEMIESTSCTWNHRKGNENFEKNLEAIPCKHSIDSLQKKTTWNVTRNTESIASLKIEA